ncbi:hypothetical protein DERF_002910 [Dermatophagoides farinae]|uniref:Uncharacterized protein n=1 Tax=Dermatophagoides farinae TaxID=6954 RepID=A0A922LC98_DERFA|nr:hypothetical protein DERF_002910 [Dermatophagoides farinae]
MTKGSRFYYHNCIAVAVVSHNYHFEDMHKHITHCSLRLGGLELDQFEIRSSSLLDYNYSVRQW